MWMITHYYYTDEVWSQVVMWYNILNTSVYGFRYREEERYLETV